MHIGIDLDGVVIDSHAVKPVVALQMFGVIVPAHLCTRQMVIDHNLLTGEQYDAVNKEVYSGRLPMKDIHQACLYIRILQDQGHQVRAITSRSVDDGTLPLALNWLSARDLSLQVTGVGYGKPKTDFCEGLELFVDDDLEKLTPLVGRVEHLLLFSSPTNRRHVTPRGIYRVDNWWEIYNYIREGGF